MHDTRPLCYDSNFCLKDWSLSVQGGVYRVAKNPEKNRRGGIRKTGAGAQK